MSVSLPGLSASHALPGFSCVCFDITLPCYLPLPVLWIVLLTVLPGFDLCLFWITNNEYFYNAALLQSLPLLHSDGVHAPGLFIPPALNNQIEPHLLLGSTMINLQFLKPASFFQAVMELCHILLLLLHAVFQLPHLPLSSVSVSLIGLVHTPEGLGPLPLHQVQVCLRGRARDMGLGTRRV